MAKLEKAFGLDWEGDKETLRRSGSKTSPALRERMSWHCAGGMGQDPRFS